MKRLETIEIETEYAAGDHADRRLAQATDASSPSTTPWSSSISCWALNRPPRRNRILWPSCAHSSEPTMYVSAFWGRRSVENG